MAEPPDLNKVLCAVSPYVNDVAFCANILQGQIDLKLASNSFCGVVFLNLTLYDLRTNCHQA